MNWTRSLIGCSVAVIALGLTTAAAQTDLAHLAEVPVIKAALADSVQQREADNALLIELTEVAAPPFEEAARAADVAEKIRALGLSDVTVDEVGNVIARRSGKIGKRTIAVIAHIDTVFPAWTEIDVRREGDVFYSPGVGDNTRGVVVMLAMIRAMETYDLQTDDDVLFVGSVGEEGLGDLRGVRHLFREGGPKIDAAIAIDGGGIERVVTGAVGSNRYKVTFAGPGGHSYGAYGRVNPHNALADAIVRFAANATPITQHGVKATYSIGRIGGGTSVNSIPFNSWMEVDMRSADPQKLAALDAVFRKAVADALEAENGRRLSNDPLTVELESIGKRPAGQGDRDSSLVRNVSSAVRYLGETPDYADSSTDSNIPISLGIPAVTIGRGGISRNAHAPNESWEDVDGFKAVQLALLSVLAEAGYAP